MKIASVEVLHCDAGWRPWTFVKITTDDDLIGWSECTDSHGSPRGIEGAVRDLSVLLVGQDPRNVEKLYWEMYARTRQNPGGVIATAIGGIENALLDIKARAFGIPVYELFGGTVREQIPLYWSHCGTTRVRAYDVVKKPRIKTVDDVRAFADEIKASGYKAIKTNMVILGEDPYVYMPGFFKGPGGFELNPSSALIDAVETYIGTLRASLGKEIDIILDLNFNFKTEGFIKLGRLLEPYDLLWLEIDTYDPQALLRIREAVRIPIASCENLYGTRQYRPFYEAHAMDIASIDIIWNGFARSRKVADLAELYEMNIIPHNYNGHLSTMISAQFSAHVPNLRLMEIDVDDVPWRDALFTRHPVIEDGLLTVPKEPGWGTEVNEEVIHAHPWPRS